MTVRTTSGLNHISQSSFIRDSETASRPATPPTSAPPSPMSAGRVDVVTRSPPCASSQAAIRRTSTSAGVTPNRMQVSAETTAAPTARVTASTSCSPAASPATQPCASAMRVRIRACAACRLTRSAASSWRNCAEIRIERICATKSQAARTASGMIFGSWSWQAIRPQSLPSTSTETDMVAAVPMLRMYSRCTGDTDRSTERPRSRPSEPDGAIKGTGS